MENGYFLARLEKLRYDVLADKASGAYCEYSSLLPQCLNGIDAGCAPSGNETGTRRYY